jgi:hypothetical protein
VAESLNLGEPRGGSGRPVTFRTATALRLRYPSVDYVVARLVFRMTGYPPVWNLGLPVHGSAHPGDQALGNSYTLVYPYASFPQSGYASYYSELGPDQHNGHSLPAFKLTVQTYWDLSVVASWRQYYVSDHNYRFRLVASQEIFLGRYVSYRAADPRDSELKTQNQFCVASPDGFIPVTVIEGQAALTQ